MTKLPLSMTYREWLKARPWWWFVNPWLYIKRRDMVYWEALDIIHDISVENLKLRGITCNTVKYTSILESDDQC